jgi:hypothetical protein
MRNRSRFASVTFEYLLFLIGRPVDLPLCQRYFPAAPMPGRCQGNPVDRAKGTVLGRPRTDAKVEARIRALAAKGVGKVKIAKTLGVGVSLTQRVLGPAGGQGR